MAASVFGPALASRNASGTYSLPTGNPVVSGTTISSTVHNNTMTDLGTEVTDSLNRSGKGAMLAPLELVNGSVSAPAVSFDSDTDCGLYRIGTGNPALAADGVKAIDWTSSVVNVTPGLTVVGDGGTFISSVTNRPGIATTGNGSGAGIAATGGTTGPGGTFTNGTAATGGTRQDAFAVTNGDIKLDGVAYATKTVAVKNRLTPNNLIKAWARVTTDGAGNITLVDGFNVASVALATSTVGRINFAQAMADANFGSVGNVTHSAASGRILNPQGQTTARVDFQIITDAGAAFDMSANAVDVNIIVLGTQ